jgi:hypothetical protein
MSRYAGRHRDADPSLGTVPEVPAAPSTLELGPTPPATASSTPRSRRSRVARGAGAVVALSLLAVGAVDVVTTRAGDGAIGLVAAPQPTLPPQAALEAVAYRADTGDLSTHRTEVRDARAEAEAAAARATAEAARVTAQAAADAAAKAAADAAAKAAADAAAAEAQRQAAADQAARDAQRQSVVTNAKQDPKAAARALLAEFGFADSQFTCLNSLWTRESNWIYTATNPSSGAYGIPQSLPASKMASAGADYRTNPVTQIKWGLGYIQQRYGSPCGAWAHSQSTGWY